MISRDNNKMQNAHIQKEYQRGLYDQMQRSKNSKGMESFRRKPYYMIAKERVHADNACKDKRAVSNS